MSCHTSALTTARTLIAASIIATVPLASPVLAQGASGAIEEVVVSARKRDENLQDVPLSVLAIDQESMSRANMQNLYDISSRVAGMKLSVSNITDAEIFMRGIGSDIQSAAADRAVGIFIDGVYMARNTGSLTDLYDLERVEVLKGPQSLLFGKNIVGGLIHYVTRKPTDEFTAKAEATIGDYHQTDFSGAISGPLGENVFGSLSGISRSRDGYARNTATGKDQEDLDSNTVRAQLRFTPSEDLDILLSADTTRLRAGPRWVDVAAAGDSDAVSFIQFFGIDPPAFLPGWNIPSRNAAFVNRDERRGPKNVDGYQDADLWGGSARIDWQLSESLQLSSITAYRKGEIKIREDGGGLFFDTPLLAGNGIPDIAAIATQFANDPLGFIAVVPDDYFDQIKTDDVTQVSQELTLAWKQSEALNWRFGAFFMNEDIERAEAVNWLFPDFNYFIAYACCGGGDAFGPDTGGTSTAVTESDADNFGVYAEVIFDITDALSLDAGLRYAKDEKDFTVSRGGLPFDGNYVNGPFTGKDSASWDEWLPTVSLSYKLGEAATLYARYAVGYKAGGWNGENALDSTISKVSFAPEKAKSFEVGGKFDLADGRVRFNVAAYFTKYDDLQTQQFVTNDPRFPPNNVIVNAGNGTEAKGIEADFTIAPVEGITLFGNYAWSDCEFTGTLIVDSNGTDIDGNTCRRTPENSYSVGAQFEGSVGSGSMFGRIDYNWTDRFYFDNENLIENDDEFTLNAAVGYTTADRRWELSAWGKNLTDELNNSSLFSLFGTLYANYTPPRTYGMTLRWNMP